MLVESTRFEIWIGQVFTNVKLTETVSEIVKYVRMTNQAY